MISAEDLLRYSKEIQLPYSAVKEDSQNELVSVDQNIIEEKLLSDVVHKIKNGLGGIGGFATLLDRDIEANDPRKRFVNRIQDTVILMNEFVVNLMTLTRIKDVKPKKIRLPLLITDIWRNYWGENEDGTPKNPIPIEYPKDLEDIQADSQQMNEMVYHAIHFIQSVGGNFQLIRIDTRADNNIILLFRFNLQSNLEIDLCDIAEIMKKLESVEARLSIGIVQKMEKLHQGDISINPESESNFVLNIQIRKGL